MRHSQADLRSNPSSAHDQLGAWKYLLPLRKPLKPGQWHSFHKVCVRITWFGNEMSHFPCVLSRGFMGSQDPGGGKKIALTWSQTLAREKRRCQGAKSRDSSDQAWWINKKDWDLKEKLCEKRENCSSGETARFMYIPGLRATKEIQEIFFLGAFQLTYEDI